MLALRRCCQLLAQHSGLSSLSSATPSYTRHVSLRHLSIKPSSAAQYAQEAEEIELLEEDPLTDKILAEKTATREIENLDPENARKLKILQMEHCVFQSTGVKVPDHVSNFQWMQLLKEFPTKGSRQRYYSHLFKIEKKNENAAAKKEINLMEKEKRRKERQELIDKGLYKEQYTYILYLRSKTMVKWQDWNAYLAMMNGTDIVIDMAFVSRMKNRALSSFHLQLLHVINANRLERQPYHIHFCNAKKEEFDFEKKLPGIEAIRS